MLKGIAVKYHRSFAKQQEFFYSDHFVFSVFINEQKMLGLKTGVRLQPLLRSRIEISELNGEFWQHLRSIEQRYLLSANPKKNNSSLSTAPIDYVFPPDWINEINLDSDTFVDIFLPRLKQLLLNRAFSHSILEQVIKPILTKIMQKHEKQKANRLGKILLREFINSFKKVSAGPQWRFYSFVFNLLQETFSKNNYYISVSKFLVDSRLPLRFLTSNYFSHPKNVAARQDLLLWFQEDFSGKEFINYWLAKHYPIEGIKYLCQVVVVRLNSDEKESVRNTFKAPSDILKPKQPQLSDMGLPNDPAIVYAIPAPQDQKQLRISSNQQAFLASLSSQKTETPAQFGEAEVVEISGKITNS